MKKSNLIEIDDLIKALIKDFADTVYTSLPARVVSFNTDTMRAIIQPLITHKDIHGQPQEYSVFSEVPVLYPNSADVYIRTPLNKDDLVFVSYSTVALDILMGINKPADPDSLRKFSLKDAFVVGGYRFDGGAKTLSGFSEDIVIHRRSTNTIIRFAKNGDLIITGAKKVQVDCQESEVTCNTTKVTCNTSELVGTKHTITGLVDITGDTTIKGLVDITGALAASGGISGSGGSFTVDEGVMVAKGIKTAKGVDLDLHTHTDGEGRNTSIPIT